MTPNLTHRIRSPTLGGWSAWLRDVPFRPACAERLPCLGRRTAQKGCCSRVIGRVLLLASILDPEALVAMPDPSHRYCAQADPQYDGTAPEPDDAPKVFVCVWWGAGFVRYDTYRSEWSRCHLTNPCTQILAEHLQVVMQEMYDRMKDELNPALKDE